MRYVLDASVALKWVCNEEDSGRAEFLREELEAGLHEYLAPDIFPIEIAHVLTKFYRQNVMRAEEVETHLASIMATPAAARFVHRSSPSGLRHLAEDADELLRCLVLGSG